MPAKPKPARKTKPAPAPPTPSRGPVAQVVRTVFRPGVLVVLALIVSAWFFAPMLQRVLPQLDGREEYRVRATAIHVTRPPRCVPPDFVDQAVSRAGLPEELSLLDEDLTREIAEAFGKHPWVRRVVRVEKSFPARVTVDIEYRVPVAMVRNSEGKYPVDEEGILLPPADFSLSDTTRFPTLVGVNSKPRKPEGNIWNDTTVIGGARIAAVLLPVWRELGVVAIRMSDSSAKTLEDADFALVTQRGSRILWGRAPGVSHPGELTVEQKLGRLDEYREKFGSFDAPHGPYEIDIRHWQEISRRPLTAARRTERR